MRIGYAYGAPSLCLRDSVSDALEDVDPEAQPVHALRPLVVVGREVGRVGAGPQGKPRLPLLVLDAEAPLTTDFAQVARDGARLPVRLLRPLRSYSTQPPPVDVTPGSTSSVRLQPYMRTSYLYETTYKGTVVEFWRSSGETVYSRRRYRAFPGRSLLPRRRDENVIGWGNLLEPSRLTCPFVGERCGPGFGGTPGRSR